MNNSIYKETKIDIFFNGLILVSGFVISAMIFVAMV